MRKLMKIRELIKRWLINSGSNRREAITRLTYEVLEDRTLLSVNPIILENQKPGNPISEWGIPGAGDPSIQGFATDISVNKGQTIGFKINTDSRNYVIDIYRMGYYGGLGARKIDSMTIRLNQPQTQPAPLVDPATGLVDAGNWRVTATWQVPSDAVSGIYFAKLTRLDGSGGSSHIYFVVRDDDGRSDILVQTSDTTWQAYNSWGGKSLYDYLSSGGQRAFKVSYNRPFDTRSRSVGDGEANFVFWAEYPLVRWLERNGYNVSYFTNVDTARYGEEIKEHKVFITVGHDEYWSAEMWQNVQAARDAGVHIVFLAGNNIYWKVRWEASIDGSGTPYRTLVCYKESLADAKIDPLPNVWTGLWRDPRFSPPADGGIPENRLGGTIFTVNRGPDPVGTPIEVPYEYKQLRLWRYTDIQNLRPGEVAYLGQHTLGYEWNEDLDNGFRPPAQIRLSSTTQQVPQKLLDYGKTVGPGVATHHLTLDRANSGALVFSAGTVQWVWGLDSNHDGPADAPDVRIQQATVNLLADMGVQPGTLEPGLVMASPSSDFQPPTIQIANASGTTIQVNTTLNLQGTASDVGGGVVGGVEVSWDGGLTWHPATGTATWNYAWTPTVPGTYQLLVRAIDDSVNIGVPASITIRVTSDDITAPVISNIILRIRPDQAAISWSTNEPADSLIQYGLSPDNLSFSIASSALVVNHELTITGLSPNTTYYWRISSADGAGNRSWYPPDTVLSFRTPAFVADTVQDFQAGVLSGGAQLTAINNGEVTLRASLSADFADNVLPSDFTSSLWMANGSVAVSGGQLQVQGAMVRSFRLAQPEAVLEFRARFLSSPYQHIGFSSDLNQGPWFLFSTKDGSALYARSNAGTIQETNLGNQWLGSFHIFRIEWSSSSVRYFIDEVLVAQHAISYTSTMPVVVSDYITDAMSLDVDWIRLGPYESAGYYLSPVLDAGNRVFWDRIEWNAYVPPNGALEVAVRMGNSPSPDDTWTTFLPLSQSGLKLSGTSRYIQYRIQLSAVNPTRLSDVPMLDRIAIFYSAASNDTFAPSVIQTDPAPNATVNTLTPEVSLYFDELLDGSSVPPQNVQVIDSSTGQTVSGTLQVRGGLIRWSPSLPLAPGHSYIVQVINVTDLQGNRMTDPFRLMFSVAGSSNTQVTITHATASDFQGGSLSNTIIADETNGSIILQPALWDNFNDRQLGSQWNVRLWQSNSSVQLGSGSAQINGSAIFSAQSWSAGRFFEARALFTGAANQHLGLAIDLTSRYWTLFSVGSDGRLYARTRDGKRNNETPLSGNWFNQFHTFRIMWLADEVRYYIDSELVARHAISPSRSLGVVASDAAVDNAILWVDWVRVGPYAPNGTYMSRVLDAGTTVHWGQVSWVANQPVGTSVSVYIRAGDTAQPDSTWSPFTLVRSAGDIVGLLGRYVQYQLVLTSSDAGQTPLFDSITLSGVASQVSSVLHSSVQDFSLGNTSNIMITNQSGGELQLRGRLYDDFASATLDSQWTYQSWSSVGGGPATLQLSGGVLRIGGSAIVSTQPVGTVAVQAKLEFSTSGYQNFGLATNLDDPRNNVWVLFGTSPDGSRLLARANIYGNQLDRDLGAVPVGRHLYRIVPYPDRIEYYIDGTLAAVIQATLPQNVIYRLAISDYYGVLPIIADWVQAAGFPAQGTYESSIINAGALARWTKLAYSGIIPTGATVIVETRTGNSPTPDSTWSNWAPVDPNGTIASPSARYLQYRITMLSGDPNITPIVESVQVEWIA